MSNVSQKHLKQLHKYMLNKYYVSIRRKNNMIVYVFNTLLNEQQLQQQLYNMYNDAINIYIECYDAKHDVMINDIMKLNNICVARNVQCYNL